MIRIVNNKKFIRSIAIVIFLLIAIFNVSIAKSSNEAEIIDYTIAPGQTLWSIAKEYTPNSKDIRQTIYEIKQLNNMTDSTIYPGQTIQIKIGQWQRRIIKAQFSDENIYIEHYNITIVKYQYKNKYNGD